MTEEQKTYYGVMFNALLYHRDQIKYLCLLARQYRDASPKTSARKSLLEQARFQAKEIRSIIPELKKLKQPQRIWT